MRGEQPTYAGLHRRQLSTVEAESDELANGRIMCCTVWTCDGSRQVCDRKIAMDGPLMRRSSTGRGHVRVPPV
jgi:hypothetical protein